MSEKIINRIEKLREEIRKTPYHKGTEHHIGKLRAKIARLKDEIKNKEEKKSSGSGKGYGVKKQGDATCVLIGPPSVGKSTLLNALTGAKSKIGDYAFTTLDVVPGMFKYQGAQIQLLDVPGLIIGAAEGKGDGKQIISVARNTDLIILLTDVHRLQWLKKAEVELYQAGVRLDIDEPEIKVEKLASGGISVIYPFKNIEKLTIIEVAKELGYKNAKIIIKERLNSLDRLIDGLCSDRVFLPSLSVVNKIDLKKIDSPQLITISAQKRTGTDQLKKAIWNKLNLIRVYLKENKNNEPNFKQPLIMRQGDVVKDAIKAVSEELYNQIDEVLIWGEKAKHPGQVVSLNQPLFDEAVLYFKK